ncbi:MAG: hypothetical protein RLZZ04_4917, partial [Cyanobacteriota bacterium]
LFKLKNNQMMVRVHPSKLKSDSQSVHDDQTRNSEGRSWKQGAIRQQLQLILLLTGSFHGELVYG